jgi:hypothetical protein
LRFLKKTKIVAFFKILIFFTKPELMIISIWAQKGLMQWFHFILTIKFVIWLKKRLGIKVSIDSQPLKVKNYIELRVFRGRATYCWKALNKGYNFVISITSIKGLHKKLSLSKVARIPILRILGFLIWES